MSSARLGYIDIAKALGLMMVIGVHCEGAYRLYSGFYIPLFFVLSGFTTSRKSGKGLLSSKFSRLLVPYFFFNAILLLIYRRFSLLDLIGVFYARYCLYPLGANSNVIFLRSNNMVLWFLPAMYVAYLLFAIIERCENKAKFFILVLYFLLSFLFSKLPILLPWSLDTAFVFAIMIFVGNLMRKYALIERYGSKGIILLLLVIYMVSELEKGGTNISVREYGSSIVLFFITAFTGSYITILFSKYMERTFLKEILIDIGRHSLIIFCIQMVILDYLCFINKLFFEKFALPANNFSYMGLGITKVIITSLVGLIIAKLMARIFPFLR